MNNKSCGCNKNMASQTMPRMPRCMEMKPACNSCKANNSCCEKKPECSCNVMGNENKCGTDCRMRSAKNCNCGCNMERTRNCDCGCNMERAKNCDCGCNMERAKNCDYGCNMERAKNCDCGCNMQRAKTYDCGWNMNCAENCDCECNMDWAKKYESSCSKCYDDNYVMPRKYRRCNKGCELTFGEEVDVLPIGMGYVPYQEWDCNVSNACQGLYDGTIFPELVKPFVCTYCYGERSGR